METILITPVNKSEDHYFDSVDSYDKAWVLGFLYADGYVDEKLRNIRINLSLKDLEMLEKIKAAISFNGDIKYGSSKCQSGEFPNCSITINNKKLTTALDRLGCMYKKSLILQFPTSDKVHTSLLGHFIRGYFDGDGCVTYRKSRNELKVNIKGTLSFLTVLKEILLSSKISSSLYKQSHGEAYNLDITGYNNIVKYSNYIYANSYNEIRMNRKYQKFLESIELIHSKRKKIRKNYEKINF